MDSGNKSASAYRPEGLLTGLLLWWLALALPVIAQDQTISQMVHTSWTGRDGAPQGMVSLAQTPDGILWIGTFAGLFAFDGLKFDAFAPKSGSPAPLGGTIQYLFVSKTETSGFPLCTGLQLVFTNMRCVYSIAFRARISLLLEITGCLSRCVRESAGRPRVEESFGEGPVHSRPNHLRGSESSQPAPIRATNGQRIETLDRRCRCGPA